MDEVQFVDDYRLVGIIRPEEESTERLLVVWDTTTTEERQLIFEMPTRNADMVYEPKSLMDHSWAPTAVGLHRSDPARRAVGVICRGTRDKVHQGGDYMVVINAADVRTHTSRNARVTEKVPWCEWEHSATVIKIAPSMTKTTTISGCRLFAMTKGFSGLNSLELLRIYDFSPGTRSGRYQNRPPVRDIMLNLGHGTADEGEKRWCFSEDNLLLFHVSIPPPPDSLVIGFGSLTSRCAVHRLRSPMGG